MSLFVRWLVGMIHRIVFVLRVTPLHAPLKSNGFLSQSSAAISQLVSARDPIKHHL